MAAVLEAPKQGKTLASKRRAERGGKFWVRAGIHLDNGPEGCECDGCFKSKGQGHAYMSSRIKVADMRKAGIVPIDQPEDDIVESDCDLEARYNAPNSVKFERVKEYDLRAMEPREYPLDKMTYPQLLAAAEDRGIDAKNIAKKEDLLKLLKGEQPIKKVG